MNNKVKCFDVVKMVTDEATSQFAPVWRESKERIDILKQYCQFLDKIADEFNGVSFDVEVDDMTMTIAITLECDEIVITEKNHPYYSLAQRAISFGFSVSDELMSIRTKTYVSGRGRNSPAVLPVNQAGCLRSSLRRASSSSAVGTLTMPT